MNRIKKILKAQGRTQAWLAEQIGRSYVVTTNYCNNKSQPNLLIFRKIAKALDVDIRDLLSPTKNADIINLIMEYSKSKTHLKRSGKNKMAPGTGRNRLKR
jgi:transcriptional regulator with XRE-family HTH domain